MKRLCAVALLLTSCMGTITFQRVEMMALVDDQRTSYNLQANLVNRACTAGSLPLTECQAAADDGAKAVKAYDDIRTRLLAKETVDANTIIQWLLLVGAAIAHSYGIPLPSPGGLPSLAPTRTPALMPLMR